jgi:hypothetical protein
VVERWAGTTIGGAGAPNAARPAANDRAAADDDANAPNAPDALSDALLEQPL